MDVVYYSISATEPEVLAIPFSFSFPSVEHPCHEGPGEQHGTSTKRDANQTHIRPRITICRVPGHQPGVTVHWRWGSTLRQVRGEEEQDEAHLKQYEMGMEKSMGKQRYGDKGRPYHDNTKRSRPIAYGRSGIVSPSYPHLLKAID